MGIRYEHDYYGWAMEQAALLRAGHLDEVDVAHLIEEVESMGKGEKRELKSRLTLLMQHLLKWRYQPTHRCRSWRLTIQEQRRMIPDHLHDNPSLKPDLNEVIAEAYALARGRAADETDLAEGIFPAQCPWSLEQMLDPSLLPDP